MVQDISKKIWLWEKKKTIYILVNHTTAIAALPQLLAGEKFPNVWAPSLSFTTKHKTKKKDIRRNYVFAVVKP